MSKETDLYRSAISRRNVWIYTFAGFLVMLICMISLSWDAEKGFNIAKLVALHRDHPAIILLEAFPLYLFLILHFAARDLKKTTESYRKESEEIRQVLENNAEFARALSEGDNPEPFPAMLESPIGKALKMIHLNIMSNRRREREITWITEGKEMVSRILRMYNEMDELSFQILKNLCKYISSIQGAVYLYDEASEKFRNVSLFAFNRRKYVQQQFSIGEGLVGQCAFEMDYIYRTEIPEDYITITSGILGDQKPSSILLIPLITNDQVQGVIEFAFLESRIPKLTIQLMLELGEIIARSYFNLRVNMKTRSLLEESRRMTAELKENESVMQKNAEQMRITQQQLERANTQLKMKIEEEKMAQKRLHLLLENASEIISIYDKNYRLKYISPSVEQILGYSTEEMVKGKDFERIDHESVTRIRKAFEHLQEAPGENVSIEYTYIKKDGKKIFLSTSIKNLLNDPSVKGFIFNTRDITESRQIEKEQRLKSRMQSLSENSLDMILRISTTGMIYYSNPVIEDYSGHSPARIVNKSLEEVSFREPLAEFLKSTLHQITGQPEKLKRELNIPVPMGEKKDARTIQFNIIPEFQDQELETILFVGHDITEAKRIEHEIKVTNRKMQDSINYAERIQSSILPSVKHLKKAFPGSFIFYRPRDVISGDFPWFTETEDAYFIAAIDCTGHGVPGALLSFIGFFLLQNITALNANQPVGEICDALNLEVRRTLKQDQKNPETRDGMDLALCKIYKHRKKMEFAGAHRPLYLLREGEITVFKGDRKSIGGLLHPRKPETNFITHEITLYRGDKLFLFSDGLTDQLGGPDGLKYSPGRIRDILLNNPGMTTEQFHDYFRKDFRNWLGDQPQIDDVLMIGLGF